MEEVLEDLYSRAQSKGYGKTIDDFTTLIYSNDDVLEDMYGYVQSKGYAKTKEDFENLIGKKKDFQEPASASPSEDGSLEQPVDKVTSQLERMKDREELTGVTPELLEKGESFIVPQLNYLYGDQGFTFDEADILGKEIKVTAANGQSKKIPLGLLRDKEAREQELKDFIIDNREESINIRKKQIGYNQNKIKFESDEAFQNANKKFADEAKQLQDGYDLFIKNEDRLDEEIAAVEAMTGMQRINNREFIDDLNQRIKDHNQARINLEKSANLFNQKEKELNQATGEYFAMKEQQGSLGRLGIKKIISSFTRMGSEYTQSTVDIGMNIFPMELQMGEGPYKEAMLKYGQEFGYGVPSNAENLSIKEIQEFYNKPSDQERMVTAPFAQEKVTEKIPAINIINKKIDDDNRKQVAPISDLIREDVLEEWTNKSVSEQYEAAKTEGFWGGALYGLAESLPALLTSGFPQRMANLYTLTSSFVDEEMAKNPMFDDIPESEKAILKTSIALPSAFFENLGFRNVINQKGLITNVLKRALDKTPNNAGPSTFKEFIRQEALSPATKAALTVTGAAAAEFETGALQQVTEDVVKIIYNDMKDKGLFETPETATEFILDVLYSGAQEAVGGFILGVPNAISNAYTTNNFNNLTPQQLAAFKIIKNDPNISQTAFTNKLKAQINQGTLTPEQAKQIKTDYELAIALASQIPDNISDAEFASVMNKLVRRKKLQDATQNKDPNLVKNDLEEIQQINAELAKVNERPVQKETTEETLDEVFAEPEPSEKLDATQTFFTETTDGVETVSDNLVINNIAAPETTSKIVSTITDIATKAANSISSVLPNTRIILHQSNAEFEKYAPAGKGFFDPDSNIIHVNLEKATNTTVPHEMFHALVVNKMSDPQTAKLADSMMRSVRKALPKGSALGKRIDDFAALYNDQPDFQNEERLAELLGIMSAEYTQLTKPQKNKLLKAIQDFLKQLGINFGFEFTKSDSDVIDLLNTISGKVAAGETITETDIEIIEEQSDLDKEQEQGEGGQVGTFTFPKKGKQQKAPSVKTDTRSFSSLIADKSLQDFKNQKFVTNMYDFTSAGPTEIAPGIVLDLYGGKSYVPYMMEKQGLNLGGFSNLAAFNTQANAETFKRNVEQGDVNLFAPHVGTLEKSWQFQQNIFEQLTFAALDNNILSNEELINLFNSVLTSIDGKKALEVFNKNSNLNIKDFNSFQDNPKELVELLDIKNNYSPELRKLFNDRYSGNAKYKDALKVNNKIDFVKKFQDPLNVGSNSFDLISVIEFDNKNLQISQPNVGDVDYHPSFAFTIKANIEGIYQPDFFYETTNVTDSYTKYNITGASVSVKEKVGEESFKKANVASSSGSIPKVATIDNLKGKQQREQKGRQQRDIKQVTEMFNMNTRGFITSQANERELKQMVAPLGYEVRKSGYNQFGQGGDYFLVKDGKRYKPPRVGRQQRDDKFYQDKVKEARSKGIKDALIYDYLRRKEKLPVKKIKELFEIDSILLGVLPESFKSIDGGAKAGLKLFLQVEKKLGDLRRKNKTIKEPLSEREITDQVFEFFMGLPAYKKAADKTKMSTTQAQMLVDLQKALDEKISTDLLTQLKNSREIIRQRTKGISDVKKLQQELINFMRRNLPRTSFTKSEAINLIRKIQQVNSKTSQANLENLMEEVMDVVVAKNNRIILSKINKLLAKKYEAVVSGRKKAKGVDVDTNARIKRIKNSLFAPGISVEEAQKQIDKLNAELFSIGLNEESTDEDFAKATDIQIALNYNKAMLMEMDDMYTTDLLLNTLSELETLIKGGRQELQRQLELANREYRNDIEIAFESITGEKVDMQAPDYKTQLEKRQTKRQNIKKAEKSQNLFKNFIISTSEFLRRINDSIGFGSAEALEGLMDRLDKMPGEMFGGNMQKLITKKVDASTRSYKARMLQFQALMEQKIKEIYGLRYEEVYRDFKQTDNEFYKDKAAVEEAQKNYNDNKNDETKRILDEVLLENTMYLSQHQMANYVLQYKDPALLNTFKKMFGEKYAETMADMESKLDSRVKKMSDFIVNEYYPGVYPYYNSVYRKIYRTNMPFNKYYSGPLIREGMEFEAVNLLGDNEPFNTQVASNFTKFRLNNTNPIKAFDLVDNVFNYTREMEYFAAYAENLRSIDKLFKNNYIRNAIVDVHGKDFYKLVTTMVDKIATRGINTQQIKAGQILNSFNNVFIISTLGLNPSIALKQLTSIPTYMNEVGPANWIKYSAKNKSEQAKIWKEVRDNSVYMQDRRNNKILRTIETYNPDKIFADFIPTKSNVWAVNFLMSMIKFGDRTAIMLGGLPNYSYYKAEFKKKNPNATEQEAIDHAIVKFEKDTKTTQQSQDLQDRDIFQNSNPLYRQLNMYLTTPKQYLRKEIISFRNLYRKLAALDAKAGKGTVGQNLRTFAVFHFIMPLIFQYVSLGLPGILRQGRDGDDDDLVRAAVLGNLNALFLIGEAFVWMADFWLDKPWARTVPGLPFYERILNPLLNLGKALKIKDPVKRAEKTQDALYKMLDLTGAPISSTKRWTENVQKVIDGDTDNIGEAILRLFNFSDYQISGPRKTTKTKPIKQSTKSDLELDLDLPDLDLDLDDIFD